VGKQIREGKGKISEKQMGQSLTEHRYLYDNQLSGTLPTEIGLLDSLGQW